MSSYEFLVSLRFTKSLKKVINIALRAPNSSGFLIFLAVFPGNFGSPTYALAFISSYNM